MKLPALRIASRRTRRDLVTFSRLLGALVGLLVLYTAIFHLLMLHEGRQDSWFAGVYWTMETMCTLGYGDIIFTSDVGRFFSLVVLGTGVTVLFIFLPFTLIEFFYAPWLEHRAASRAPRELPPDTFGHVLLTAHGPIEAALIDRLSQLGTPYAVLVPDTAQALALHDQGLQVMVGRLDDAETYRRARADRASLVATTLSDAVNTNVALTVRDVSPTVPIVATATWEGSVALLQRAGCHEVVQLGELLGRSIAGRIAGRDGRSHVVAEMDSLLVAEAAAANTPLIGQTLRDLRLPERFRITVAGVREGAQYVPGGPDVRVGVDAVLLLSGDRAALDAYDEYTRGSGAVPRHVIVIGGGRVGRATARALAASGIEHRVVERDAARMRDRARLVVGDAADPDVLDAAGLGGADSIAVTTRDDDANVYLTLQCRRLRPDAHILSRVTHERNTSTLYRAGADVVLSYFPMEAAAIFGVLRRGNLLLFAEGLDVFTVPVPQVLAGRSLAEAEVRTRTGCTVLAVQPLGGETVPASARDPLRLGMQMVVVGDRLAARRFFQFFLGD